MEQEGKPVQRAGALKTRKNHNWSDLWPGAKWTNVGKIDQDRSQEDIMCSFIVRGSGERKIVQSVVKFTGRGRSERPKQQNNAPRAPTPPNEPTELRGSPPRRRPCQLADRGRQGRPESDESG